MQKPKPFLLQDHLRGTPPPPLPSPPSLSSLPSLLSSPSSLSPQLLSSLSSFLLSSPPLPSPSLSSLLSSLSLLLSPSSPPPPFPSSLSLLLGSLIYSHSPSLPSSSPFTLFLSLFQNHLNLIISDPAYLAEALAGIGYAISRAPLNSPYFNQIFSLILTIWSNNNNNNSSLENGIMVLKLTDWCASGFIASGSFDKIKVVCSEITDVEKYSTKNYVEFAGLMSCCGVLRALTIASSRYRIEFDPKIKESIAKSIGFFAKKAILGSGDDSSKSLLIKCIALGLARCGRIGFDRFVIRCLCLSLLNEIFPLKSLFQISIQNPDSDFGIKLREHTESPLFKESGAVTGVLCNQYSMSDEESKNYVENQVWDYSKQLYGHLRNSVLVRRGKRENLLHELERVAESAFLMIVVFANEVTKCKLNPKPVGGTHSSVAVSILVAFSCVEYLRRVRLPEYTDSVRRAVLTVQENLGFCGEFVGSMPSYAELTAKQDFLDLDGNKYNWSRDDVQTARIFFYLRVIPTCISLVPASIFGKKVAPIMFLYMQHPNEKVARASHSVLVSFVSSFSETDKVERLDLKEKLSFYYIKRSLEAYPGVTPFEGLASGVAALVRNLPAGSPGAFYCTHSLVSKAKTLCQEAMNRNLNLWKSWEGSSEPCKKIVDLLLRLVSLLDIQVLPYLLRELAGFIAQLPTDGQDALLGDMYTHVAESDDVTRKPVLVSWLQSLSYISSQSVKKSVASTTTDDSSLNGISARL